MDGRLGVWKGDLWVFLLEKVCSWGIVMEFLLGRELDVSSGRDMEVSWENLEWTLAG